MKITEMALRASRLTYLAAVIILVAGIATFLNFPSQEEPSVTIRDAVVAVLNPGMPAERVEQLIARPIEERLRELAEVKRVTTTVRAGGAVIQVTIWERYTDLAPYGSAFARRLPMLSLCFHRVRWGHLSTTTSAVLPWPPLR